MPTIHSALMQQCWENAYSAGRPYRVPVESVQRAIAFRAQCHKYRRKIAEQIYGPNFEEHYLYDLEVVLEGTAVVFRQRARVTLPPVVLPPIDLSQGMWCVMKRPEGLTVERHVLPITDPAFVSGHDTKEQAEASIKNTKLFPSD